MASSWKSVLNNMHSSREFRLFGIRENYNDGKIELVVEGGRGPAMMKSKRTCQSESE